MSWASISPAIVWIRSVVAIGRPSAEGTRSFAKALKKSWAARATPTYSAITAMPAVPNPAASAAACAAGSPRKFSAGTSTFV